MQSLGMQIDVRPKVPESSAIAHIWRHSFIADILRVICYRSSVRACFPEAKTIVTVDGRCVGIELIPRRIHDGRYVPPFIQCAGTDRNPRCLPGIEWQYALFTISVIE